MATVIYQGEITSTDGHRGLGRPPQFGDRVEHVTAQASNGNVERVDLDGVVPTFYVRWPDGFAGWYRADELVVRGGAPASDPSMYVDGASQ